VRNSLRYGDWITCQHLRTRRRRRGFEAYQGLEMLRLHRLGYSDHVDGGGAAKTAGKIRYRPPPLPPYLSQPPTAWQIGEGASTGGQPRV
jgi:hypothetical protein